MGTTSFTAGIIPAIEASQDINAATSATRGMAKYEKPLVYPSMAEYMICSKARFDSYALYYTFIFIYNWFVIEE
ncbi:hypothetical protein ES703_95976 [subsurface metagenome]